MHGVLFKKLCWAMVFVLFISWSGIRSNFVHAEQKSLLTQKERELAAERLERLFEALEEAVNEIPRDTFEPEAIVNKVGWDPIKLFEWVRDNTYLVPYRGSLRGPIGVLMDRLGNSLDRALLLHELLTIAGHKAQLVQGSLTQEQAKKVLKEARPIPPEGAIPPEQTSPDALQESIAKYAEKYGLNPAELQKIAQSMSIEQQNMAEEVAQRVEEQTKAILDLIGEIPDIREAEWKKAIKALQDHWWVQCEKESNRVDLDPTFPNSEAGKILVNGEATYQPEDLGEDFHHLVTIRIIIERWEEGALEEEKVLEHTLRPSELFGKRVVLRHIPLNWPEGLDLFAEENPIERLTATVLEEKEWLPVLGVGSEQIWKFSFTDTGRVPKTPEGEPAAKAGEEVRRGLSLFGPPEEESKDESYLTAEWVEYEIHVPDEPVYDIRRPIFDLLEPAMRLHKNPAVFEMTEMRRLMRGIALVGGMEIFFQVCDLSWDYLDFLTAKSLLGNHRILIERFLLDGLPPHKKIIRQAGKLQPIPGINYKLAFVRRHWRRMRSYIFHDRPNILTYLTGFRQTTRGEVLASRGFDIVENTVAVIPQAQTDPFRVRLEQGVLDTNAEDLLLGGFGEIELNTADVFIRSQVQKINWVALSHSDDPDWRRVKLPENTVRHLKHDLLSGHVVFAPCKAIQINGQTFLSWWRLNTRFGTILGFSDLGGAKIAYMFILKHVGMGVLFCLVGGSGAGGATGSLGGFAVGCLVGFEAYVYKVIPHISILILIGLSIIGTIPTP